MNTGYLEVKQSNVLAYWNRGTAKTTLCKYADAIKDFDKAIELAPKNSELYFLRASAKATIDKYTDAIKDFYKAIELSSDYANCLIKQGACVQLDSMNYCNFYGRGYCYKKIKKYELALADFEKLHLFRTIEREVYD